MSTDERGPRIPPEIRKAVLGGEVEMTRTMIPMTAAPAPLTCEEEAAKLLPCRCGVELPGGPEQHAPLCPAIRRPAVAAALRARQMAGRQEAGAVVKGYLGCDAIADRIAALPEVP